MHDRPNERLAAKRGVLVQLCSVLPSLPGRASSPTSALHKTRGETNGYGLLVRVLAYFGLRWGEASGLRAKGIDFTRGRLEVHHTIVEVDGFQIDSEPMDYELGGQHGRER